MNRIALLFTLVMSCLSVQAQEINHVQNRIYGEDSLEQRRLNFGEFDIQGKDHVWNLEGIKTYDKEFKTKYSEQKDTIIARELCAHMVYDQTEKDQQVVAMQDYLSRVSYDMPEEWLRFPMKQGDSISGHFNSTGMYCDRLFMRRFGTYKTKADSVGKLILPKGDTLHSVMRLHTERYVSCVYGDKDTLQKEVPKFTVDSIVKHMAADSLMLREDVYRWYAAGYRYPILEARITSMKDKPIEQLLFYCIPEEQEKLASNDVNKEIRDAVARAARERNAESPKSRSADNFRYEISQNDNGLTIRYQAEGRSKIVALLASNQGYVYQRREKNDAIGSGSIDISTNGLRRGQYVIYINVDGKGYAEKVNVK